MRNPTRSLIGLLAVAIVLGVMAVAPASAAIVNGVQSGTTTMSGTSASVTVTLGRTVDATRAFVTCTYRNDDDLPTRRVTCNLNSAGTGVVLTQQTADNGTIVRWNVADFQSGVSVQRGTALFAGGETEPGGTTVTLGTAVDLAKSFVLVTDRPDAATTSNTIDEQWTIRGRLTGSTTLELMRVETGIAAAADWQVVTMEGASVQRGTACIGGTTACGAGSDGQFTLLDLPTAVDTSKSFIVISRMGRGSIDGIEWKHVVGADFPTTGTSVTGVRLARQDVDTSAGNEVDIAWEVVALSDGSSVRRGLTGSLGNLGGGTSILTSTAFTAVDTTRSMPFVSLAGGSGNNTDDGRETQWTATLNATTFTFQRGVGSNRPTAFGWQAVEFFRCVDHPVCSVSAQAGSGSATVYWSSIYNSACTGVQCHVLVLRQPGGVTATPTNGTSYSAGATIGSATVAYSGTGTPSPAGSNYPTQFPAADTGLSNGTSYCYKVYYKTGPANTTYNAAGSSADCSAAGEVLVRPAAGNTLWSYAVNGGSALNAPISGFGQVFAATNGAKIASLDSSTGANLAVFARTHGAVQSYVSWFPVSTSATDETVVAADLSGYVYAINALDGTVQWSKKLAADGFKAAVSVQLYHNLFTSNEWRAAYAAAPYFYTGDVIFVATRNTSDTLNEVFALRATDGSELWKYTPATSMDKVLAQPYVDYARNRIYIASLAGFDGSQLSLRVLDSTDGTEIACDACAELGDIETAPSLAFDWNTLYVGTKTGMIHAITLDTLQSKWTAPYSTSGKPVKSLIWEDFDTAGKLYFVVQGTTADEVWSIQDDGDQASPVFTTTPLAGGRLGQPVIGDSTTYPYLWLGGSDGKLYQLRLSDGQALTEAGAPQPAFTVGDGTKTLGDASTDDVTAVYVGTSGGTLYKIQVPLP